MDIKPPKGWRSQASVLPRPVTSTTSESSDASPYQSDGSTEPVLPLTIDVPVATIAKPRQKRRWMIVMASLLVAITGVIVLYFWLLQPVTNSVTHERVSIANGTSLGEIAKQLESKKVIRSALVFELYCRLNGSYSAMKSGSYVFSGSESTAGIVTKLTSGQHGSYNVTILPGMTLKQLADPNVKGSLAAQGFSAQEIEQAYTATYDTPLLKDKPANASLEGYIYPETYQITADESLQDLFRRTFDELYTRMQRDKLVDSFTAQKLTMHQALTLASIVQKEVGDPTEQKQVAQVFLKRLNSGIMLGSDVTYMYAAAQAGVTPSIGLDSPYNTRKYAGLPPGPIANMNYSALEAVAHPAQGDYLYFVAGDDGHIYYSRTDAEHTAAVAAHCKLLCANQ